MFSDLGRPHYWTLYSGNAKFVKNRLECGSKSFGSIIDGSWRKYHFYRDKSSVCKHVFVAKNTCLTRHKMSFVAKNVCLSRRDKHIFLVTKRLLRQLFVATNILLLFLNFNFVFVATKKKKKKKKKKKLVETKHSFVPTKVFVAAIILLSRQTIILMAAPANDIEGPAWTEQTRFRLPSEEEDIAIFLRH